MFYDSYHLKLQTKGVATLLKKYTFLTLLLLFSLFGCFEDTTVETTMATTSLPEITFQTGRHIADESYYDTFNLYYYETDFIKFYVQSNVFDLASAITLFEKVEDDYNAVRLVFNIQPVIIIYVVDELGPTGILGTNGEVFCLVDDITGGSFRSVFVSQFLGGMTEPWKMIGASELVFGLIPEEQMLLTYYSSNENIMTLSLFAGYFYEAFSDIDTLQMAQLTAISFTQYLISHYGTEVFLSCQLNDEYRQEWLSSIGSDLQYHFDYNLSFLDGAIYSSSESYPLIIKTEHKDYYLSVMEKTLDSPEKIMEMFSNFGVGMESVLSSIETNSIQYYAQITSAWNSNVISYYFNEDLPTSYADTFHRSIYLQSPMSIIHETIHMLIPIEVGNPQIWQYEGISTFFSFFGNQNSCDLEPYYLYLTLDSQLLSGDDKVFLEELQNYYLQQEPMPFTLDDFNYQVFYEAMAVVPIVNPDINITEPKIALYSISMWRYELFHSIIANDQGNDLTYPQAYLFTEYMIETYGLDTFLSYCLTPLTTFDEIFGISFENAFIDFSSSLIE